VNTQRKELPIGKSDFETIITGNYYYADKTLLVAELIQRGAEAVLFPRPRRFGKTLNMTMLKAFFEKTEQSKRHLFDGLAVSKLPKIMAHQGQYPVIFVTFKDVKFSTWQECYPEIVKTISNEFRRHDYLLSSSVLDAGQKQEYQKAIDKCAPKDVYQSALRDLSSYLHAYHQKKVIILIDEYDTVIQEAYLKDFYDPAIEFMRAFLGGGLKDNAVLERGVVTGILRIAKESIFTGLNNLLVGSFFRDDFADKFGLTESEVMQLLTDYGYAGQYDQVKAWYNGYCIGNAQHLYNPWSIINFAANRGIFEPYWVNTSRQEMIQEMIASCTESDKQDIELLLAGQSVEHVVDDTVVFQDLGVVTTAFWSFLLYTGYLTFRCQFLKDGERHVKLAIPNRELLGLYKTTIQRWFARSPQVAGPYLAMLKGLVAGNMAEFKIIFEKFARQSLSVFDVKGPEPESFYHALVLGVFVSLQDTHEVRSNRESGYGRYDVMIIPKDPKKPGIIIEFKKIDAPETLEKAAVVALQQIRDRRYATELRARGIEQVIELAIVFKGKEVLVQERA
jgi:hypothetical protein